MLGAAILAGVVLVVLRSGEERAFVRLLREVQPGWLLIAILLQAATYFVQGEIWQIVLRPAKTSVRVTATCKLSVARLFVDQALPSAGLSGTVLAVQALRRYDVPLPVVMAGVVIDTASCYATYAIGLVAALIIAVVAHHATPLLVFAAFLFLAFALAIAIGFLQLSGHPTGPFAHRLARFKPLGAGLHLLEQADPHLSHSRRLLVRACACQAAIVLLDVGTMWVLIAALGAVASPAGVFASFMMSTLLRFVGIVPGGLGVFEAASVLTLRLIGVELSVALSATLLFRGLSFWLPLVPGFWFSRQYAKTPKAA